MKKKVIFIILILITIKLSAQYRNTYWGETIQDVAAEKSLYKGTTYQNYNEWIESKKILGESSQFSYIFINSKLQAIGYEVSYTEDRLNELKNNINQKTYKNINTYKTTSFFTNEIKQKLKEENIFETQNYKILMYDDVRSYMDGGRSMAESFINNTLEYDTGIPAEFIIARYSNTTDVYIYANIIEDKIIVIYTKHEDDF